MAGIEMIETIKATGAENGFFEKMGRLSGRSQYRSSKIPETEQCAGTSSRAYQYSVQHSCSDDRSVFCNAGKVYCGYDPGISRLSEFVYGSGIQSHRSRSDLQEMRTDMERVEDVMNYPEDIIWRKADGKEPEACLKNHSESLLQTESSQEEEYRKLSGHIELKNVTFGYSRLAQPLIRISICL